MASGGHPPLAPGDSVDISITAPDTRWEDVTYAVGGLYWILKDGVVDTSLSDGAAAPHRRGHQAQRRGGLHHHRRPPKAGHKVGRHHSNGGPAAERAGRTNAILLDGGGSTTMVSTYPDYGSSSIINKPSDGTPGRR